VKDGITAQEAPGATSPAARITVIVRTLWRASLAAALASIDAQLRSDVDIVLVDARGSAQPPPTTRCRLRVVSTEQALHRTRAAQLGLEAVRTGRALFLDDDDVLLEGHLDKLAAALDATPDAVLAHTGVELVRETHGTRTSNVIDDAFEPWELLLGNRMPIHAVLFDVERARAAEVAFDDALDLYEDWDFWLQLSRVGRFLHVPGVSARYFVGAQSSDVHRISHGDTAYFTLWRKWWALAPQTWWAQALRAGVDLPATQRELRGAQQHAAELWRHLEDTRGGLSLAQAALQDAQQQIAARIADIAGLHGVIAEQAAQAQRIEATLATVRSELAATAQVLAATRIERQRISDELQTVLHSSSWRITQPLRDAIDRLRAFRVRLGSWRRSSAWRVVMRAPWSADGYARWITECETPDTAARRLVLAARLPPAAAAHAATGAPLISVVMPVFNANLSMLDAAIESLRAQSWPHWQLCVADDASTQPGVLEHLRGWAAREPRLALVERAHNGHISAASNSALSLAQGDWVALLDQDDLLAETALAEIVDAAAQFPDAGLIYSDEDKVDAAGRRFEPFFKPAFSVELLRGQNFINHLVAYRRRLLVEVGGFREGFEGAQDHELALRVSERLRPAQVVHVPRVLYHWRVSEGSTAGDVQNKPYAEAAALHAVQSSLARVEPMAQVEFAAALGYLRVRYPVPEPMPAVVHADEFDPARHGAAWVLLCHTSLVGEPGWLEELAAQLARNGVGVVSPVVTHKGLVQAGGYVVDGQGKASVIGQGLDPRRGGNFGRHALAQGVTAVTSQCMLMRSTLWPQWCATEGLPEPQRSVAFAQAVRAAGWRLVWTPFARVEGPASQLAPLATEGFTASASCVVQPGY
jgi:O-antigen biosynthesis protein